jgi:hypothetical protein
MSGSLRPRMRLTLAATCQARRRRPPVPITRAPADACRRHTKTQPLRDADAMIVLRDIAYLGMQPREILQATRNVLTGHYGAAKVCTGRRRPDRPCRATRTAHPIWVRRSYPPASLTYAMASPRTTTRAHSAVTRTRRGELDSTLITVISGNGVRTRLATKRKRIKESTDGNRRHYGSFGARAGRPGHASGSVSPGHAFAARAIEPG